MDISMDLSMDIHIHDNPGIWTFSLLSSGMQDLDTSWYNDILDICSMLTTLYLAQSLYAIKMFSICEKYAWEYDMKFSGSKSVAVRR